MARSYSDQVNDNNILLIRQILAELHHTLKYLSEVSNPLRLQEPVWAIVVI